MAPITAYDTIPYDDRPVAETHPDRLWIAARTAGLAPTEPASMQVLELGCANAVNLVPMAFHIPGAQFVGMDLSSTQIARAQKRVQDLGVSNLRVECADVLDYDPGEGPFDLIIAHGLFSWVPEPVRDRVLSLCHAALAPQGIAYISYNAMPAWGVRDGIGRVIRELAKDAKNAREKVSRARAGLAKLQEIEPLAGTAEGHLIVQEIGDLQEKGDAYLLHEYMVPARAYWREDFGSLARKARLRVIADVAPSGLARGQYDKTVAALRCLLGDGVGAEQAADVLTYRQFSAAVLCREDAPRQPISPYDWIPHMHVSKPVGAEPSAETEPQWRAVLEELNRGDVPFSAMHQAVGGDAVAFSESLYAEYKRGAIGLRPRPLAVAAKPPAGKPSVCALTRFEAKRQSFVTNPLHECAPLDAFHAALIAKLDGTKTRDQLAGSLADDVLAGRLDIGGPTPSRRELRAQMAQALKHSLRLLCDAALLLPK